jgi:hypothetical protein
MYDNSQAGRMRLIAAGSRDRVRRVAAKPIWQSIVDEQVDDGIEECCN